MSVIRGYKATLSGVPRSTGSAEFSRSLLRFQQALPFLCLDAQTQSFSPSARCTDDSVSFAAKTNRFHKRKKMQNHIKRHHGEFANDATLCSLQWRNKNGCTKLILGVFFGFGTTFTFLLVNCYGLVERCGFCVWKICCILSVRVGEKTLCRIDSNLLLQSERSSFTWNKEHDAQSCRHRRHKTAPGWQCEDSSNEFTPRPQSGVCLMLKTHQADFQGFVRVSYLHRTRELRPTNWLMCFDHTRGGRSAS